MIGQPGKQAWLWECAAIGFLHETAETVRKASGLAGSYGTQADMAAIKTSSRPVGLAPHLSQGMFPSLVFNTTEHRFPCLAIWGQSGVSEADVVLPCRLKATHRRTKCSGTGELMGNPGKGPQAHSNSVRRSEDNAEGCRVYKQGWHTGMVENSSWCFPGSTVHPGKSTSP